MAQSKRAKVANYLCRLNFRSPLGSANIFKDLSDLRPFGVQHLSNKRLRTAVDNSLCVGPTFGRRPARHKRADRQRCRAVRNRDKEVRVNEKPTLASPSWRAFSASYRMRASRKQSPRRPGNLCDLSK